MPFRKPAIVTSSAAARPNVRRLRVGALCVAALAFSGCYLLKQGAYLAKYEREAVRIEALIAQDTLGPETTEFLKLVKDIRVYATETLGLKENRNYSRYVDIEKAYLLDVVSACKPNAFEPYQWQYPFFGAFPYRGFFERRDAQQEAARLQRLGYDVLVRRADAFSSLGYFTDPVYSFMTRYSVFEIASLIIHEQTHATIYLVDQVQFNEELATFVGYEGALEFVRSRYGEESTALGEARAYLRDFAVFRGQIREIYDSLDVLYNSGASREEKLRDKQRIFERAQARFADEYESRYRTDRFLGFKDRKLNNAYIMAYTRYTQDLALFYDLYELYGRDLRRTIDALKGLSGERGDAKNTIKRELLKR